MLYLLNSFLRGGKVIKKIGFTDNIRMRNYQYISHAPGTEIVSVREGDELLETEIHYWLTYLNLKYSKLDEWFIDNSIVNQVFHISQNRLEKLLWKHRKKIFNLSIRNALNRVNKNLSVDFKLFDYLFKKFKGSYTEKELVLLQIKTKKNEQDYYYYKLIHRKRITQAEINQLNVSDRIKNFLEDFESLSGFKEKMRFLCNYNLSDSELGIVLNQIPLTYKNYYLTLGPERLYSLGYDITKVSRAYSDLLFDKNKLNSEIYSIFKVGDRIAMSDIKSILTDLYNRLGYNKSPLATDLEEYFELKHCLIMGSSGKRVHAFKLLSKKGDSANNT